mgnify:FL=1
MKPIKILIQKLKQFNENFFRYYKKDKILLNDNSRIKTEAQLCCYMYRKFGVGRYKCMAYQKGVAGFWVFWLGNLYENGFIREIRKNKEIERLKNELHNANKLKDETTQEQIEQDIEIEREFDGIVRLRGIVGLKKYRPGILHSYEEF